MAIKAVWVFMRSNAYYAKIADVIMQGGNSLQIAEIAAQEGINNIRQSGLKKAAGASPVLQKLIV